MSYLTPTTLDAALGALSGRDTEAPVSVIAGGTDWFPAQGERAYNGTLLDVTRVEGMRGVSAVGTGWRIGGATTWSDILHADLPPAFDGLKLAAREVGSVQIQNAGTVAGNICNASPAADGVPPLLSLDAEVELTSTRGVRRLVLAEFITGVRKTARAADEIVTALYIPALSAGARGGFTKIGGRKYLVISVAMVGAVLTLSGGRIATARITVGSASPVALRMGDLENALVGADLAEALERVTPERLAALSPISDIRGSAEFRGEAVVEAIRRTLTQIMKGQAHG
ncbi:FAD binding domain-containing protein [Puniceibacterium sediminis]|uniref:CO or xanthine dehydrogenase, FAD-binding subunit n=1 Tax=Puniceibacterium sediminis TaxID=1608407 RepID=A0A238UZX2_9RHOB|nr:FAD binding domain-containing protein [Puniceibacterium sediminis]SNR27334.1 CO or xanthine dehydrogenase, FAD-binding subunit [Puniceibacterium sediminis]